MFKKIRIENSLINISDITCIQMLSFIHNHVKNVNTLVLLNWKSLTFNSDTYIVKSNLFYHCLYITL